MDAVRDDMKHTEIPTWVSPAPSNWGTAKRGKLSADQWKVICTVHLPVTLIRLWGHETGRTYQMLSNFMDLVKAVQIINMRITSEKHISLYEKLITRYLTDLKTLYKDAPIQPIHHASLHLGDFARLFGPVHPYRSFATERYNYMLQRQNVNMKFGAFL
jgi:hypothetical protein